MTLLRPLQRVFSKILRLLLLVSQHLFWYGCTPYGFLSTSVFRDIFRLTLSKNKSLKEMMMRIDVIGIRAITLNRWSIL